MGLAMVLIPLIPGLVQGIISIIDNIKGHSDTPEEIKAQLDAISLDLKNVNARVQAVQLPGS